MEREKSTVARPAESGAASLARLRADLDRRRGLVENIASLLPDLLGAARVIATAYRAGGKAILFGNGGSHADATHLEAELIGRCRREREPLAALTIPGSAPTATALANDYGQERALARALLALARPGDAAIAFSTSGRSSNVVEAARAAREHGLSVVAFTGREGGDLARLADVALRVPADDTPIVQEAHRILAHLLVEAIEAELSPGTQAK